jgi:signal transduction histidine kinase
MVLTDADATTQEYLGIIKQEIDNSLRIITDLLDFARTKTPQRKSIPVHELLNKSIGKCIIPKTVKLQIEIPDTLPLLRIDPLQLEQVFLNLVTNAVQAMPGGGSLQVAAHLTESSQESAQADTQQQAADVVAITVEDTGEGIAPENMQNIFQPLFTTKAKGIGLGLVICKNLVEINGGKIKVESEPDRGTTFTVELPIERGTV